MSPDPFDTLGLPARFDLDPAAIQRAYLARTAALPPDGSPGADESRAAALNKARIILEDPEQRASTLLARLGGAPKEADRTLPDGFLMEMMDVRERIDAEKSDPDALDRWEAWGEQQRREHIRLAGELFASTQSSAPADPRTLAQIRRRLNAWRYIERMLEQLREGGHGGAEGAPR